MRGVEHDDIKPANQPLYFPPCDLLLGLFAFANHESMTYGKWFSDEPGKGLGAITHFAFWDVVALLQVVP